LSATPYAMEKHCPNGKAYYMHIYYINRTRRYTKKEMKQKHHKTLQAIHINHVTRHAIFSHPFLF